MKYGLFVVIGGVAALAVRRMLKKAAKRRARLGAVSEHWLARQRSERA